MMDTAVEYGMMKYRMIKSFFIVIVLLLIFSSAWYHSEIELGGFSLLDISEVFGWILLITLLANTKVLFNDPKLNKSIFYFSLLGLIFLFDSLVLKHLDFSSSIGAFRRFFYLPIFGLFIGKLIHIYGKRININVLVSSIKTFPFVIILLIVINAVFNFREITDNMIVVRNDAFILFFYFIYILQNQFKYKSKFSVKRTLMTVLLLVLIILTASRGVLLATTIFTLVFFLYYTESKKEKIRLVFGLITLLSIILYVLSLSTEVDKQANKEFGQVADFIEGKKGSSGDQSNNIELRYFRYLSAIESGARKPIMGNGLGFKEVFFIGGNYNKYEEKTAHNIALSIWYKMGAIGLLSYGLFFLSVFRNILFIPAKLTFAAAYFYSLVDVMMASNQTAIISIYIIAGFYYTGNKKN